MDESRLVLGVGWCRCSGGCRNMMGKPSVRYFHIREGLIYFQAHGFHPSSVAVDDGGRARLSVRPLHHDHSY